MRARLKDRQKDIRTDERTDLQTNKLANERTEQIDLLCMQVNFEALEIF